MAMRNRDFLSMVPELVRSMLPPHLREFQVVGPTMGLVKLHYGDRRIHYEVWLQRRHGQVEVGLHFEAEPERNARYLEYLSGRLAGVRDSLGPGVEAEQWTPRWTRVHRYVAFTSVDDDLLFEVAGSLAALIRNLEPLVREAPIP